MLELQTTAWIMLALAAFFVGFSKTGIPGISSLSVVLFASVIPAKESTATMLLLLIICDIFAVFMYRKEADFKVLFKIVPHVVLGVISGAIFLYIVNDQIMRQFIGILILILTLVTLLQIKYTPKFNTGSSNIFNRFLYSFIGGFTTMVANSGGPAMSMYLILSQTPIKKHIATIAFFFFSVNLIKLPFSIVLGLFSRQTIILDLYLLPIAFLGAFCGYIVAKKLPTKIFDTLVLCIVVITSILLIL